MRPGRAEQRPVLVEAMPSRWDDEPVAQSRALLAGLAGSGGVALEFVARPGQISFYVRAASDLAMDAALDQLRAAYPQAGIRRVGLEERPYLDPARAAPGEICSGLALRLTREPSLPLATDTRRGDPFKGVLAAAAGVRGGERLVAQLVLCPADPGWPDRVRRHAESPASRRREESSSSQAGDMLPLIGLLGLSGIGLQSYEWYQQGQALLLAGTAAGTLVGLPLVMAVGAHLLRGREDIAAELVKEKLAYPAFRVQLRVLAFGPDETTRKRLRALVSRVADAYEAFGHPIGNSLRPQAWRAGSRALDAGRGVPRSADILNAAEIAALWHLPETLGGLTTTVETGAHRVLPPEERVARGCRVGASLHQGQQVPAYMPAGLLFRNQLVVAKTRRGKSTLLVHMASHLMQRMAEGRERLLLVVVDPHQDLAEAVLGMVPAGLEQRVAYLNLADRQRPIGLNLLTLPSFPTATARRRTWS
ncbi:MAG: hypothetical protein GEU75_10825 [Dehalococcoidia bacterium]|nr:hypothetical protein [Dehalococcoidia bacterium]